jgi:hypothetical protein
MFKFGAIAASISAQGDLPLPSAGDGLNCLQFYNFANDYDMTLTAAANTNTPQLFASPNGVNRVDSITSIISSSDVLVGAPVTIGIDYQITGWPTDPLSDGSNYVAFGLKPTGASGLPYSSLITPQGSPFPNEAGAITIMTDLYIPDNLGNSANGWIAQLTDASSVNGPNKGGLQDSSNPANQKAIKGSRNISAYSNQRPTSGRVRLAVVLNGNNTKFYINSSTESNYSTDSGSSTFNRLRLFSGPNANDQYEGHMRNFAIYDGVLPVSDINDFMTREYEAGTPSTGPVTGFSGFSSYSDVFESDPTGNIYSTSTDGSGSGATIEVTSAVVDGFDNWLVTGIAIDNGGTGYRVDDTLYFNGIFAPALTITSIS